MKNEYKNKYRNVIITSIITAILITSGIGIAYAADNEFWGTSEFGDPSVNVASGENSATFGAYTSATAPRSAAFGWQTAATGSHSVAFGDATTTSGVNSAVFGIGTTAQAQTSFVIGGYNEILGDTDNWVSTDPLFVIGNGIDSSNRNNAVTVLKNGNVGIGISIPTQPLQVEGVIESTIDGFKFPDGTTQSTASTGDITGITAGTGLSGGGTTGDVTLNVDTSSIQNRVIGSCSVGSSISAINSDGTVTCEHDDMGDSLWMESNVDMYYNDGNVGIGTSTPNSQLELTSYLELATSSGEPPATDCDDADEIGRMKVDGSLSRFYICVDGLGQGISWKTGALR